MGAVVSGVTVKSTVSEPDAPSASVTVTVFEPLALSLAVQLYVCSQGADPTVAESDPKTVGKSTLVMPPLSLSASAVTVKLPLFEPVGA